MTLLLWVIVAFFSGAIPFSLLIGTFLLRKDIRSYGDGNPGAANVLRAGGIGWFALAGLLDIFKGTLPVGLAYFVAGYTGIEMTAIAIAPVLGHAFSPFLKFSGGKAVAVTFGIWMGLTIWEAPTVLGIMLGYWFLSVTKSGWAVILAMLSLLAYLLFAHNDPTLLMIWAGNMIVLVYKHRQELTRLPGMHYWLPILNKPEQAQTS